MERRQATCACFHTKGVKYMSATLSSATKPSATRERLASEDVATLVNAAAAGAESGWDGLVQEFGEMVLAVARAHRLGEADAADVAQITWLRLLEHLGDLHDAARVGGWLATTARRECLGVLRHIQRQIPFVEEPPELESVDSQPDEELMLAERDQALWRSFARLRPRDQALLRLLIADPHPYEEIAAVLEIPIGSIGPTRARALERLRQQLETDRSLDLLIT